MKIGEHVPNATAFRLYERFRSYVAVEEDVCAFFERNFLAERRWQAAVVSEEISSSEANKLASICRKHKFTKAWALDINNFDSAFFYSIHLEPETLSRLEEIFLTPSYLLVEEEERFMLVSDGDYFWEIAGPQIFLEDVFEKSLQVVDQEFMDATSNYRRSSSLIGRSLTRLAAEAMERSLPIA